MSIKSTHRQIIVLLVFSIFGDSCWFCDHLSTSQISHNPLFLPNIVIFARRGESALPGDFDLDFQRHSSNFLTPHFCPCLCLSLHGHFHFLIQREPLFPFIRFFLPISSLFLGVESALLQEAEDIDLAQTVFLHQLVQPSFLRLHRLDPLVISFCCGFFDEEIEEWNCRLIWVSALQIAPSCHLGWENME